MEEAKKPFIFVGGGAVLSGASKELKEFVEKLVDAPVTDSLMGKGAFPGTDPIYRNAWYAWNESIQLWSKRM